MSTRANIAVYLKEKDVNQPLNFMDERFKAIRPTLKGSDEDSISNKFTDIKTSQPVLQIYNHHDGYPDHLMTVLTRYYNDYERALALVLAGDTSFVDNHLSDAYVLREDYNGVKPRPRWAPKCNEDYLYVFKDDKWVWERWGD